jgi:hypothetical protein
VRGVGGLVLLLGLLCGRARSCEKSKTVYSEGFYGFANSLPNIYFVFFAETVVFEFGRKIFIPIFFNNFACESFFTNFILL